MYNKMNIDSTLLHGLQFVTGDSDNVCRLCLGSTNRKQVWFGDVLKLDKPYFSECITITEMLEELGISPEPLLPQTLCRSCVVLVTNCYLFRKLCEYSKERWENVFTSFHQGLQLIEENLEVETAFLLISKDENKVVTSKRHKITSKKLALAKVTSIIKSRSNYHKKIKVHTKCVICGLTFKSKYLLAKHLKSHNNETKYPCKQCAKVFISAVRLSDHVQRIHVPKKLQCQKCSKMFSTEKLLKFHDKTHHEAAICKLCFVQFPSKISLRAHLDKHDVLKCPKCKKSYINKHTYKFHLKICGNDENRQISFYCDICNKGYVRKNGLRTHMKTDHGFGQVLSCNWCGKKFDAISRLKMHIVKHTKEKNYHCETCGGNFVTQAALVYHTRLHTGERPFPCDMCDERFLSASRRMEHKRRKHLGPTKECDICKAKFLNLNQMNRHKMRHYNPQSKLYIQDKTEEDVQLYKTQAELIY